MSFIYQWIDLIWIPIALIIVKKHQRLFTIGFFLSSMLMMRLQVELMREIGFTEGFTNIMTSNAYDRALATYSIFYALYLIMVYFSPSTRGAIFVAASISIFFMAFFSTAIIMLL